MNLPSGQKASTFTNQMKEKTVDQVVKDLVLDRLDRYSGQVTKASKSLGIGKSSLYRYLDKWGVNLDQFRRVARK